MKADQICDKSVVWKIENDFNINDAHFHLSRDNFCDIPSRQLELGNVLGVPKKTHILGILDISPLWKWPGTKVGCVLKKSGNSLSDRHKNCSNSHIRS